MKVAIKGDRPLGWNAANCRWVTGTTRSVRCHQEDDIVALRFPYRLAAAAALSLSSLTVAAEPHKPAQVVVHADQQLADAIANKLAQAPGLSGYQVDVTCLNGAVELTGTVRNDEQRAEVMKVIRSTSGVKKITDKLTIRDDIQTVQAMQPVPSSLPSAVPPAIINGQGTVIQGGPISSGPISTGPVSSGPVSGGFGMDPTPMMVPPTGGLYDSNSPKMPPYAWPTYAPYNNYSRVGYPTEYPQNAFPFIGPFYPFPKVPLGYRAIKLEWEDGHWYYGRNGTLRDYWKVRYW
jgi:hypothetical protein